MKYFWGMVTKIYNWMVSRTWINYDRRFFRSLQALYAGVLFREYHACFGRKNPDKVFFVIRCFSRNMGFMGLYNNILYQIKEGIERKAILVIDCQNYPNDYLMESGELGRCNFWEKYFHQPMEISLDEVYKSKNVIMSSGTGCRGYSDIFDEEIMWENHCVAEKYMRLNDDIRILCEEEAKRMHIFDCSVLGVKCRGTDFISSKPALHAIPPSVNQVIEKIEELNILWGGV